MILIGATVSLVPLSLNHLADLLVYSREPELWTWWLRRPPMDEPAMRAEIDLALRQEASGERIPFAVYHQARKEHIGSTSLWHIDPVQGSLEIGSTWLGLPFHRSGINRECKALLLRHAFVDLGMDRVVLQTDELNLRSRRAIEQIGGKLEGILRQDKVAWDGRVRSSVVYSIVPSQWLTAAQGTAL